MGRIVTPDGLIPQGDGKPPRPPRMEERLQASLDFWRTGKKDEAFATLLNAIAYQSHNFALMARSNEAMRQRLEALEQRVK